MARVMSARLIIKTRIFGPCFQTAHGTKGRIPNEKKTIAKKIPGSRLNVAGCMSERISLSERKS
jgi:hypothetical protein